MQASVFSADPCCSNPVFAPAVIRIIAGVLLAVAMTLAFLDTAAAQSCNADFDCRRLMPLGGGARCIGDTSIATTTRCVAGRCQTTETMRRNCATQGTGRCVGEYYERSSGRCDGSSGRCVTRTDREPCRRGCSCRGNVLIVFTGSCSPSIGCHRAVKKCAGGCACDPEPVCREETPQPGEPTRTGADNADQKSPQKSP